MKTKNLGILAVVVFLMAIPVMSQANRQACTKEEIKMVDTNGDCLVSDQENLEAIDLKAEGKISEECLDQVIESWENQSKIPGCSRLPGGTIVIGAVVAFLVIVAALLYIKSKR